MLQTSIYTACLKMRYCGHLYSPLLAKRTLWHLRAQVSNCKGEKRLWRVQDTYSKVLVLVHLEKRDDTSTVKEMVLV